MTRQASPVDGGARLPCPFCGRSDTLRLANTHTAKFWIECDTDLGGCSAQVHGEYFDGPQRRTRFSYNPDAAPDYNLCARTIRELHPEYRKAARSAIAAWNRRATLTGDTEA